MKKEKCFKGFEKGFVYRGKQYAENTVFEKPKSKTRQSGMHYCKSPFDVLDYYGLVNSNCEFNEFATVEPLADEKTADGKNFCTTKLKIGTKLGIPGFVKVCVDYLNEKTSFSDEEVTDNDNGKREAQMVSSGYCAQMALSGYSAKMTSSGDFAQMASSGDSAQMASSGDFAKMTSSGDYAQMASSGDCAQMTSSGDYVKMASSGDSAQMASSGDSAKMASSGDSAQMASSGDSAQMASSGDYAQMASSGDYAKMASSGDYAKMVSTGDYSVLMCAGKNSMARAKKGSFITLAEWKYDEEIEKWIPINVKTRKVDGRHIKEDTFYKLQDGKFVEAVF